MLPLILALTIAAPAAKDGKKEQPTLVGTWNAVSSSANGMKIAVPEGASVTFHADGTLTFTDRGKGGDPMRYTHDAKKSPAEFDVEVKTVGKELSLKGIYKIEGDTLTFAMAPERPKSFEEGPDNMARILVCKRAKKE